MTSNQGQPMDSLNARFLGAFNEIEGHFRHVLDQDETAGFTSMLGDYEQRFRLPEEQRRFLREMSPLRNAISHGLYYGGRPIAEPNPEVVDKISLLSKLILTPPTVWDCLGLRGIKVSVTTPEKPIRSVLQLVHDYDYSQVPVYEGKHYVRLLTTNCIARWLAARLDKTDLRGDERVSAVLEYSESHERALLVPKSTTAAEAVSLLSQPGSDGYRPTALILTTTGSANESARGVIVDFDLPALNAARSLPHLIR